MYLSNDLSIYLSIYPLIYPSSQPSIYPSIHLFIYYIHASIYLPIHPSIYLPGYGSKFGTPIIRWLILNIRMLKSMVAYTHTPKSLQCLRLTAIPNQNARHDPCPGTDLAKPLSPLETLALTSLDQTIMVLFVFDRIPSERRFPTGLFSWALLTPTNKNAKQALFLVCILQEWVLIKEKTRSKTRSKRGTEKAPHLHTWTLARKPQTCPSLDHW